MKSKNTFIFLQFAIMHIFKNIKSLADIMHTMQQLEDPEFLTEQWLTEEDVGVVKKELEDQMEPYKAEVQSYIEYKLTERQEHVILSRWISDQITTLAERMKVEDNKIKKIDSWIDYLCKFAGLTGLKTPVAEIKYTGWDKMKVEDPKVLPEELRVYDLIEPIAPKDRETLLELWYSFSMWHCWLTVVKKRYKTLSEEQKKGLEGKIRIDDSKSISIK